jgi:hypothetical protein
MKTSMKIAAAVAVIGAIAVIALTSGVMAYGSQANVAGWQGHSNGMMDNHNGQGVSQPLGPQSYATNAQATGQNGNYTNAYYCSVHGAYCSYNSQNGGWNCPYGCVYHNQAQGAQAQATSGQWSGHCYCC